MGEGTGMEEGIRFWDEDDFITLGTLCDVWSSILLRIIIFSRQFKEFKESFKRKLSNL